MALRWYLISTYGMVFPLQLKSLHNQGFSLLSIDELGMTALHYAAQYGHKNIVGYLIAGGKRLCYETLDVLQSFYK